MALATVRTLVPLLNAKTYQERGTKIFASFLVAITQIIAFWYLCEIIYNIK